MYSRARIDDRQINELIGLAHGISADDIVNQKEAEVLQKWLAANADASGNPVVMTLFKRVDEMLRDNVLDAEESQELLDLLVKLCGGDFELGELLKSSRLPLDDPPPRIRFGGRRFVFTGTFAYGPRRECENAVVNRGGEVGRLNQSTDFVVVGVYATASWAHSSFGRKIEQAVDLRERGFPVSIVSEAHWYDNL
jgi:NAD-dependent DNA ligase